MAVLFGCIKGVLGAQSCEVERMLKDIVKKYIKPLFPGSFFIDKTKIDLPEKSRKYCSLGSGKGYLIIKEDLDSDHDVDTVILSREQIFTTTESSIVNNFIEELIKIDYKKIKSPYKRVVAFKCLEVAILKTLHKDSLCLEKIIDLCDYWSNRTYEGAKISFSIKISNGFVCTSNFTLGGFRNDFFASVTNGVEDCIVLDKDGKIASYQYLTEKNISDCAPFRFLLLSEASRDSIVIALTRTSDILLFKNGALVFARKNKQWVYYSHDTYKKRLAAGSRKTVALVRESVYLTALDVSYTKTGGIIACIDRGKVSKFKKDKILKSEDFIEADNVKMNSIRSLIDGKKFQDIHRALRAELASIDGAFIIDVDGNILSVGAIIKIPGGSSSGGRKAATIALSKYGTAIKISNDTYIECYKDAKSIFNIA